MHGQLPCGSPNGRSGDLDTLSSRKTRAPITSTFRSRAAQAEGQSREASTIRGRRRGVPHACAEPGRQRVFRWRVVVPQAGAFMRAWPHKGGKSRVPHSAVASCLAVPRDASRKNAKRPLLNFLRKLKPRDVRASALKRVLHHGGLRGKRLHHCDFHDPATGRTGCGSVGLGRRRELFAHSAHIGCQTGGRRGIIRRLSSI